MMARRQREKAEVEHAQAMGELEVDRARKLAE
jgi:hypothetical protein